MAVNEAFREFNCLENRNPWMVSAILRVPRLAGGQVREIKKIKQNKLVPW
jgi:hypothetical protein